MAATVGPNSVVDSTAAFASLEKRLGEVKDDLGKRMDSLILSIDRLADGVVRKDVLEEALKRRDDAMEALKEEVKEMGADIERQYDRSRSLRNSLWLTIIAATLAILGQVILSLILD